MTVPWTDTSRAFGARGTRPQDPSLDIASRTRGASGSIYVYVTDTRVSLTTSSQQLYILRYGLAVSTPTN